MLLFDLEASIDLSTTQTKSQIVLNCVVNVQIRQSGLNMFRRSHSYGLLLSRAETEKDTNSWFGRNPELDSYWNFSWERIAKKSLTQQST